MVQAAESLSTRSLNCLGFDGGAFELNLKGASGFPSVEYVLEPQTQRCRNEPMIVGKADPCWWSIWTDFSTSAALESAQNVPELVSFCCQIAQRRRGRWNLKRQPFRNG